MVTSHEDHRMLSVFVFVCLGVSFVVANSPSSNDGHLKGHQEYCKNEEFSPRCYQQDAVVLVTAARYGMMGTPSKCVPSSATLSEPCSEDVLSHLSGQCSGRKSCNVRTTNMTRLVGNCQPTSDFYLNASYECVKAEFAGCSKCDDDGFARVKSSEHGRIASFVTADDPDDKGCGTARCPWLIEVKPGQVINVTLVDFASVQRSPSSSSSSGSRLSPSWGGEAQCSQVDRYAVVKERANPKEVVVCGGGSSGGGGSRRHVYTSISNRVEVHISARELRERPFFVEFQAVGCADVIPPRNTWMKRADDRVEVGCPTTGAKWTMNCVDGQWVGDQMTGAKCPGVPGVVIPGPGSSIMEKPVPGQAVGGSEQANKSFISSIPDTILIAAVVAVACIIGVLVLTTGIVCIKKHQYTKRHKPARPSSIYTRATEEFEFRGEVNGQPAGTNPAETTPMMMMMTPMPPQGGAASSSRPGQRGGQPPQTSAKPRVPQQQGLVASGRRYPQDGASGAQFVEMFDPEQRQMMMIGSRPLPSIPPSGSGDRRPGMALQQAMQQFQPQQQFQTTAMMHHPYQYPSTGIPQGGCYPPQHAECTCHGPPRGQRFIGGPGYQTQPPPLAPKVRTVGTGPTSTDGWGGYGASVGGSLNRPYSEAIYGNEGGDLPIYRSGDDQHHYFVLDPDVVRDRPPSPTPSQRMAAAAAASAAASSSNPPSMNRAGGIPIGTGISNSEQRFPTPPPPLPEAVGTPVSTPIAAGPQSTTVADATVSARRQSPDGKERDESRDGGGGGGTMDELKNANRCSVHEIPLRPTRDGPTSGMMSPNGMNLATKGGFDENESMMGTNISSWP